MEAASSSVPEAAALPPGSIYAQVEQYPWDSDPEFQSGLTAILGTNSSPEQAAELTLRARCFYYSRKFNTNIDFDEYKAYLGRIEASGPNGVEESTLSSPTTLGTSSAEPSQQQDAPYPTSFAHIVELIQTGQPIPGIKEIPPTILEGRGTKPSKAKRKKPWEKDEGHSQFSVGSTQEA